MSGLREWLLFGHVGGVAVLAAGVGAYIAGLHRLAAATTLELLRAAAPVTAWGEHLILCGVLLVLPTGLLLAFRGSMFGEAWVVTSLVLFVVTGVSGQVSGSRLRPVLLQLKRGAAGSADVDLGSLLRSARSLGIYFGADIVVITVVEALFLMTVRPGGWGIGLSLVVAGLLAVGAYWALARQRRGDVSGRDASAAEGPRPS
jgi:hypothetical protein